MEKITHRTVQVNGINMHIAELGQPSKGTILFLHGFPELWYTWRHQLITLSAAGYKAVAPDLRGYGDTDTPPCPSSYTAFNIVGDVVALLDLLGVPQVYLVGHDFGGIMSWHFATLRPDRIKAMVVLSVPFVPRSSKMKPTEWTRNTMGGDFYQCRFQEPGDMEEEFSKVETAKVLKQFLTCRDPLPLCFPKGTFAAWAETPVTLPPWLSESDINYVADKFRRKGFTGGFNYYRAIDLTWELMAPWTRVQVKVPVKFIVGDQDLIYHLPGNKDYIHKGGMKRDLPFLQEVVVMPGVGHFINQEKPAEISNHIQEFFARF